MIETDFVTADLNQVGMHNLPFFPIAMKKNMGHRVDIKPAMMLTNLFLQPNLGMEFEHDMIRNI